MGWEPPPITSRELRTTNRNSATRIPSTHGREIQQKSVAWQQSKRQRSSWRGHGPKICLSTTQKKLKLRHEGPFVVSEITKTGTCPIDIPGFINGSKIKRYYEPLTLKALLTTQQRKFKACKGHMSWLKTDLHNAQVKLKKHSDIKPVAIGRQMD